MDNGVVIFKAGSGQRYQLGRCQTRFENRGFLFYFVLMIYVNYAYYLLGFLFVCFSFEKIMLSLPFLFMYINAFVPVGSNLKLEQEEWSY